MSDTRTTSQGVLEMHPRGYGFLRNPTRHYAPTPADPYVPGQLIDKFHLAEGLLLAGPVDGRTVSSSGKTITFRPVHEIRPDETLTFRILLRSERSGPVEVKSQASSRRQAEPATAATMTMIQ